MAKSNIKKTLDAPLKSGGSVNENRLGQAETLLKKREEAISAISPSIKKNKVVRDSFTMPASYYSLMSSLQQRCMREGVGVNKSELLRAGLDALNSMSTSEMVKIVKGLVKLKPGRTSQK
jgi:hypothetical protein